MTSEANLWWPRLHIAERSRCLAGSSAGFHCQMCRSRVSVDSLVMEVFGRTLETKLRHDFAPALPAGRLVLWPCSAVTPLDMKNIEKQWSTWCFRPLLQLLEYDQCRLEWCSFMQQLFQIKSSPQPGVTRSAISVHILPALAVMARSEVLSCVGL